MNVKYKVRFFVECMVTMDIEADQDKPLKEIAREIYNKTDLYDEVRHGNVELTETDNFPIIIDKYDADGNFQETVYEELISSLDKEEKSI